MTHQSYQPVIDACYASADACDQCVTACLNEQNVKQHANCIRLCMDSAAMARLAAEFMARGSQFAGEVAWLCRGICEACANECSQHKDSHCQACAQACLKCAEACRTLASSSTS